MTTIVTRAGKGSPLTNAEMDQNLINLNNDKLETSTLGTTVQPFDADTAKLDVAQTWTATQTFGAVVATSYNGGQLSGFRNKIINGNFKINQRAYASGGSTVANQYTFDRWKVGTTGGITYSTAANKTTVTIGSGQTFTQVIEGSNLESGTYVLSWEGTAQGRINGGSYGASGTVTASLTGGTNATINFNTGTVTNIQLEIGTVPTPFENRPAVLEALLCQRYYQTSYIGVPVGTASSPTGAVLGGTYYNTSSLPNGVGLVKRDFSIEMRAAPTVAFYSPVTGAVSNVNDGVDRGGSVFSSSLRGINVTYSGNGGNLGSMHFTASAEL